AFAHGLERPTLAVYRAVGIALAKFAFGFAHSFTGAAQLIHIALALALLVLLQIAQLLPALTLLLTLAVAPHILALFEGLVAQLLLFADHIAQLIQRRHHIVVAIVTLRAGPRHLQILEHRLQFFQQLARGLLVAGARQIFQPIEHALEILLAEHAGIAVERTRELLRILAHFFG